MSTVAVVIPVFDRTTILERALRSVRAQSLAPSEVVVVDDASSLDLSDQRELASSFGFRWLRQEKNSGPAGARNFGVKRTSGDWICFLESDDEWLPEKLRSQVEWHEKNPALRISQVEEDWIRNGQSVKKPLHWEPQSGDLFESSIDRCSIGPSCVMIQRTLWDEHSGFDSAFTVCEDYELWLRLTVDNAVGLVPGAPLVRKHAGHEGQLSFETPAMDRFRVHALLKLLAKSDLNADQRRSVSEGIQRKAEILCKGARKRGWIERADFFNRVADFDWMSTSPAEVADWLIESARHLNA